MSWHILIGGKFIFLTWHILIGVPFGALKMKFGAFARYILVTKDILTGDACCEIKRWSHDHTCSSLVHAKILFRKEILQYSCIFESSTTLCDLLVWKKRLLTKCAHHIYPEDCSSRIHIPNLERVECELTLMSLQVTGDSVQGHSRLHPQQTTV